jgi:hypothetical protein
MKRKDHIGVECAAASLVHKEFLVAVVVVVVVVVATEVVIVSMM